MSLKELINFIVMWEKIKGTLKELWAYIKWAAGIGFCAYLLTGKLFGNTLGFPLNGAVVVKFR
mgnify:CR=1 FL=1